MSDAPRYQLLAGDCLTVMADLADNSVDAIVTDPPYGLKFMGMKWDYAVPETAVWADALRVLKPGGHLLCFAGTRTQHRMAVRIEDAGFEIRDMLAWVYGSGFPKSLDVSKAIDKAAGAMGDPKSPRHAAMIKCGRAGADDGPFGRPWKSDSDAVNANARQYLPATEYARHWSGWGTALKPAMEPITLARKPFPGPVAANVLAHGTGALNVDGCRVATAGEQPQGSGARDSWREFEGREDRQKWNGGNITPESGRFPANLIHDGSPEVLARFAGTEQFNRPGNRTSKTSFRVVRNTFGGGWQPGYASPSYDGETGSAARFFYCAKASRADRDEGLDAFIATRQVRIAASGHGVTVPRCPVHGDSLPSSANRYACGCPLVHDAQQTERIIAQRNHHPTVKPTALMRYLCRLITPPGGLILDPFMGSGSTGKAAMLEGFRFLGIEIDPDYLAIAQARLAATQRQPDLLTP